jgi:hypothetical protein
MTRFASFLVLTAVGYAVLISGGLALKRWADRRFPDGF